MEVTAVLIDTVSIQKFIFSSNRLKENLGASYLVEQIYQGMLTQALEEVFGHSPGGNVLDKWDSWKSEPQLFRWEEKIFFMKARKGKYLHFPN